MQGPLKPNQVFQKVAHKQYLTPNNIDELLATLQQLKVNQDPESSFTEPFIKTLPAVTNAQLTTHVHLSHRVLSRPSGPVTKPPGHVTDCMIRSQELKYSHRRTSLDRRAPLPPPLPVPLSPQSYSLLPCQPKLERKLSHDNRRSQKNKVKRKPVQPIPQPLLIATLPSTTRRKKIGSAESSITDEVDSGMLYDEDTPPCDTPTDDHDMPHFDSCNDNSDNGSDSGWNDDFIEEEGDNELLSDINDDDTVCSSDISYDDTSWMTTCTIGSYCNSFIPPVIHASGEKDSASPTPPLTHSLFHGLRPTIHFPLPGEAYEPLPPEIKSLLKWKMSTITPTVVKHIINRVGFTRCTKGSGWIGYWGKHMKSEAFRTILEHQKVNHFPGSFQLGRKDNLWRNLFRMQAHYGKRDFDFVPQTFVLPSDMRQLKRHWDNGGARHKWIIKPPASARGIGIKVVNKWTQIPKRRSIIVQRYISNPCLINGSKFDLRVYVYVKSFDPLRIYVYRDGLVRFATASYSHSSRSLSNRYIHLTNYSINKKSSHFQSNCDETLCFGHKWGLLALWDYMSSEMKVDPAPIWRNVVDIVIKTILSCESNVSSLVMAHVRDSGCVHELFGFDIMLDKHFKPWLLEVNVSPSLHSNSQLDLNIKGSMMRDLLNIAGFHVPHDTINSSKRYLTTEERLKHSQYTRSRAEAERSAILDHLTVDDVLVLMKIEDEASRCGGFIRAYPDVNTVDNYRKYFQTERYHNILVEQWLKKYHKDHHKGITLLQLKSKEIAT